MSEQHMEPHEPERFANTRPRAVGKYLYVGQRKLLIRGVTYGAFEPDSDGREYQNADRITSDFAMMAANGVNTVRIPHTTPPRSLLDAAHEHGLKVMVGLSVEQQIGYFIDRRQDDIRRVEETLRSRVRTCADHPALLCYALGNEISAPIARWIGRSKVEKLLERMYRMVKEEDPDGLVSYVNYPTTEYLQLPFLDLLSFNVYLEARDRLAAYLGRLQNIAGDRPLLMSELGLDAMRNGEEAQARALDWQIETSFRAGCAGVFVFSWTDEWFRAGAQVDDWAFGITTLDRSPKPALASVREAFEDPLRSRAQPSPPISVIVCTFNGAATIGECCERIAALDYPDFEVLIVDDGSTDGTGAIAARFGFRIIRTEHVGLAAARNIGAESARGEILAYIDDDAYPDADWLRFLAAAFEDPAVVAAGGPNVSPPDDAWFAQCVDGAPGNPAHVLITDTEAEQLPGCNLAIRRTQLLALGGFDPRFRTAGDDVDICWRLVATGGTLRFAAGAMVLHHRRPALGAFLRQQSGYGVAEALLARKWNRANPPPRHIGIVYGSDRRRRPGIFGARVYHGVWGHAPFQSVYESATGASMITARLRSLLYPAAIVLLPFSVLGFAWRPLWIVWPFFLACAILIGLFALFDAVSMLAAAPAAGRARRWRWLAVSTLLHAAQPAARLAGRISGLRALLRPAAALRGWRLPRTRTGWVWSDTWIEPNERIAEIEAELANFGVPLTRGGTFDGWDLELSGGICGGARLSIAVEDHSGAAQMIRYRLVPRFRLAAGAAALGLAILALAASADRSGLAAALLAAGAAAMAVAALRAPGHAISWGLRALRGLGDKR